MHKEQDDVSPLPVSAGVRDADLSLIAELAEDYRLSWQKRAACKRALAILSRPTPAERPASDVGEGWVLVPREPTEEMCLAIEAHPDPRPESDNSPYGRITRRVRKNVIEKAREVWSAMLSAAPRSPTPPHPASSPSFDQQLSALCNEHWQFHAGEPPEDDSPLLRVYDAGIGYAYDRLAELLDVTDYEGGDGSEDYATDVLNTARNILVAAGYADADGDLQTADELRGSQPASSVDGGGAAGGGRGGLLCAGRARVSGGGDEVARRPRHLAAVRPPRGGGEVSDMAPGVVGYRSGEDRSDDPGLSHTYAMMEDGELWPMCGYGWNRSDGERYSIWRGSPGTEGDCKLCARNVAAGKPPVVDGFPHKTKWL